MSRLQVSWGPSEKEGLTEVLLSVVFPNLNEEETIGKCIRQAKFACEKLQIEYEIIVADNGSTDRSVEIAISSGAKVVHATERGYGSAILSGISAAKGIYIVQLDSDNTYRLDELEEILRKLDSGAELVIGNRFGNKQIEKGSMPFLHRYLGNPILSFIGRFLYDTPIKDFHCGLRAYKKEIVDSTGSFLPGMEFASELILKASLLNYRVEQFSTKLYMDERTGKSHLNTFRDGYRHIRFLLLFSRKKFAFFVGLFGFCFSWLILISLSLSLIQIEGIQFGPQTYFFIASLGIVSLQVVLLDLFRRGLIEAYLIPYFGKIKDLFRYEKIAIMSTVLIFVSSLGIYKAGDTWIRSGLGPLENQLTIQISVPSILLLINSLQLLSFAITKFITEYIFASIQKRTEFLSRNHNK